MVSLPINRLLNKVHCLTPGCNMARRGELVETKEIMRLEEWTPNNRRHNDDGK